MVTVAFLYLLLSILITVIYFKFLLSKKISNKINFLFLIFPLIVSSLIIYFSFDIKVPIESRYIEEQARSIRHYVEEDDMNYYTLIYEDNKDRELKEWEISKITYDYFSKLWQNERNIGLCKITNKDFGKEGYYEEIFWDGDNNNSLIFTKVENYYDYFENTKWLYNFLDISDYSAVKDKLFPRERLDYLNKDSVIEPRQSLISGIEVSDSISRRLSYLSSLDIKFRPILLVWTGLGRKDLKIRGQRNYWHGGNDNEVVFCVGISDTITKRIVWSGSFSWGNNKDFEDYVLKTSLHPGNILNLDNYFRTLVDGYKSNLWQPRLFDSYKLIKMPIEILLLNLICIITIILNIIILIRVMRKIGFRKV